MISGMLFKEHKAWLMSDDVWVCQEKLNYLFAI